MKQASNKTILKRGDLVEYRWDAHGSSGHKRMLVLTGITSVDNIDGDDCGVCKFFDLEELRVVRWHVYIDELDSAYIVLSRLP